jgi:major membrane immunogen (membrane-anchored lipoprotein)
MMFSAAIFSGCTGSSGPGGGSYQDGTFAGQSGEDDKGAYGEARVTIEGGRITDCEFVTWQADGSVKDENYGKINGGISNQDYYDKAQLAVRAMAEYAERLRETGSLDDVDAVTGATIAYDQFVESVQNALEQAKE